MRKNRNRPESDEPLSEGRVEYLEAARQRVRNRRIRRTAVLLVLLTAVVLFATGIAGSSVAALKDLTDTARIALLPGWKKSPYTRNATVVPCVPDDGVKDVIFGTGSSFTVNAVPAVPPSAVEKKRKEKNQIKFIGTGLP